jgi:hypothetical protein
MYTFWDSVCTVVPLSHNSVCSYRRRPGVQERPRASNLLSPFQEKRELSKLLKHNMALRHSSKFLCFVQIVVFSDIVSTNFITEREILLFILNSYMQSS